MARDRRPQRTVQNGDVLRVDIYPVDARGIRCVTPARVTQHVLSLGPVSARLADGNPWRSGFLRSAAQAYRDDS